MRSTGFSISRTLLSTPVVALILLGCRGLPLLCQTQSVASTQTQPTMPATMRDPTHPEVQLRLDVDRDPIPSPDSEDNASVSTASPLASDQPRELQKRQDGTYTLHQDVDEVLLTCAAVDEKGRLVTDLNRGNFRIWEDGVLQTANSFLHQDQPVSLGILVDNSGSMHQQANGGQSGRLESFESVKPPGRDVCREFFRSSLPRSGLYLRHRRCESRALPFRFQRHHGLVRCGWRLG